MSSRWKETWIKICCVGNSALLLTLCLAGFKDANQEVLYAKTLVLQNEDRSCSIEISCSNNEPKFSMNRPDVGTSIELVAGKSPQLAMRAGHRSLIEMREEGDTGAISLGNAKSGAHMDLKGGTGTGLFIKNGEGRVIGTWTMLQDGGTGIGLASGRGVAASILRGGDNPSVSFFSPNSEPMAAMGMVQKVPHLLISGRSGSEGILMHGGVPSSMLFVDEVGKVKILISKNGVFQGQGSPKGPQKSEKQKAFALEDTELLFPEQKDLISLQERKES
ncbi:MAG: hypothetical protein AAGF04_05115 [Chlamydiota bacterium]